MGIHIPLMQINQGQVQVRIWLLFFMGNYEIVYLPIKNDCKKVLFACPFESLTRGQTMELVEVFSFFLRILDLHK